VKKDEAALPRLNAVNRQQLVLRTLDVDRLVDDDHSARLIWELVGRLDLSFYHSQIAAVEGQPGRDHTDPKLLISVCTYTPDGAGHTISAADNNGTQYVTSATYYANGAEYQRHQPVIFFSTTLNSRLQVAAVYSNNGQPGPAFINKTYNYGPPQQNNGNRQ